MECLSPFSPSTLGISEINGIAEISEMSGIFEIQNIFKVLESSRSLKFREFSGSSVFRAFRILGNFGHFRSTRISHSLLNNQRPFRTTASNQNIFLILRRSRQRNYHPQTQKHARRQPKLSNTSILLKKHTRGSNSTPGISSQGNFFTAAPDSDN